MTNPTPLTKEQLEEIENDINDIEAYDYSDSTKKIMVKIEVLKELCTNQ